MSANVTEPGRKIEDDNSMGIPREIDRGISFFAIVLGLVHHRQVVLATIGVVVILGLLKALLSPSLYTATALVVREVESGSSSSPGLSSRSNFSRLRVNLGDKTGGVTPETYPDILRSREVLLAVANSPAFIEDLDITMKVIEYYNRPPGPFRSFLLGLKSITIGLPKTVVGMFKKPPGNATVTENDERILSAVEKDEIARLLADNLSVDVDLMSGVMSISFSTTDPQISAQITQSFINQLKIRVQEIYTDNSEDKLTYFRNRLIEALQELEQAEKILAKFIDSNWDPKTAKMQIERERLRRQVTFKTELYSELQAQLTQVELELKRSQPVITILQAPFPPVLPSSPNRRRIMILSLILGNLAAIVAIVIKIVFERKMANEESRAEWLEIHQIVFQSRPVKWLSRYGSKKSDA